MADGYTVVEAPGGAPRRPAAELGERFHAAPCDLRDAQQIRRLFARVDALPGRLAVLVNNAGLGHQQSLLDGDAEKWREMLEVNVLALCICTREALQRMRTDDRGAIVHISSMAAHRVPPGSGVYSATKYAVRSLTEGLRQELRALGSAIRVTAVSPGLVETEFHGIFYGSEEEAAAANPGLRVLDDRDVAEAVRYVLRQPEHVEVHDVLLRPTAQRT